MDIWFELVEVNKFGDLCTTTQPKWVVLSTARRIFKTSEARSWSFTTKEFKAAVPALVA
jgi:hypothetical protein